MTETEFHNVWIPLQARFYRVAWYLLEDRDDAADAVQDLYVKLLGLRDMLDEIKNPSAYGILLIRNICIDRIRKKKKSGEPDDSIPGDPPPDSGIIASEGISEVLEAIDTLPPGQGKVLKMRIFEGKTNKEIAKGTGMSELSVRAQMSMARNKIKKLLKR